MRLGRAGRRGYGEAVFCEGKTSEQVRAIVTEIGGRGIRTLFTRAATEHAAAVLVALPDAAHARDCRLLAWPPAPPEPAGGGNGAARR